VLKSVKSVNEYEDLNYQLKENLVKTRTAFSIPFIIGPGLSIAVKGSFIFYCRYTLILDKIISRRVYVDQKTNEEVRPKTVLVCNETSTVLNPDQIKVLLICNIISFIMNSGEKRYFSQKTK
jgi:hypothetical protein